MTPEATTILQALPSLLPSLPEVVAQEVVARACATAPTSANRADRIGIAIATQALSRGWALPHRFGALRAGVRLAVEAYARLPQV